MAAIPQVTPLGILPKIRAKIFRVRAVVPEPIYTVEADRVDVQDTTGASLTKAYFGTTMIGGNYGEVWIYSLNSDIKAFMTVYKDPDTGEFVFSVARIAWDPLNILFDGAIVGTAPTFPAVTADMTLSIGYVSFRAAPPSA